MRVTNYILERICATPGFIGGLIESLALDLRDARAELATLRAALLATDMNRCIFRARRLDAHSNPNATLIEQEKAEE